MTQRILNSRIQVNRDTAENWNNSTLILRPGEPALEIDTNKFKWGDGMTLYSELPYAAGEDGDFVERSGDTMSGPLTMQFNNPEIRFNDASGNNLAIFGGVGNGMKIMTYGLGVYFAHEGGVPTFRPMLNNDYVLGNPSFRWKTIYTGKLNNGEDLLLPNKGGTLARLQDIPSFDDLVSKYGDAMEDTLDNIWEPQVRNVQIQPQTEPEPLKAGDYLKKGTVAIVQQPVETIPVGIEAARWIVAASAPGEMPWWIRYNDGWVEQGGSVQGSTTAANAWTIVLLPILMRDALYHLNVQLIGTVTTARQWRASITNGAQIAMVSNAALNANEWFRWVVKGYSAGSFEAPTQLPPPNLPPLHHDYVIDRAVGLTGSHFVDGYFFRYLSGWVEQGGSTRTFVTGANAAHTIWLPITMVDNRYTATATVSGTATTGQTARANNISGAQLNVVMNIVHSATNWIEWKVQGMAPLASFGRDIQVNLTGTGTLITAGMRFMMGGRDVMNLIPGVISLPFSFLVPEMPGPTAWNIAMAGRIFNPSTGTLPATSNSLNIAVSAG